MFQHISDLWFYKMFRSRYFVIIALFVNVLLLFPTLLLKTFITNI